MPRQNKKDLTINTMRVVLALIFIFGGINHFINPDLYLKIMPAFLPLPMFLNWSSGLLEVLGGIGLFFKPIRKAASILLNALLISFFIVHIDHLVNGVQFQAGIKIPTIFLWIRLTLQFGLIYWVWLAGKQK